MNELEGQHIDVKSFAFKDLLAQDKWTAWTPAFTSLTLVGALTATGRWRIVGRKCEFQAQFSAATSIASVAGTTYMALPFTALGLSGDGIMTDNTAKTAVGACHVDVTNSRLYLPAQVASGHVFNLFGNFEV